MLIGRTRGKGYSVPIVECVDSKKEIITRREKKFSVVVRLNMVNVVRFNKESQMGKVYKYLVVIP